MLDDLSSEVKMKKSAFKRYVLHSEHDWTL